MKYRTQIATDATVTYDVATLLLEECLKRDGMEMLLELVDQEPAIVAVAISNTQRLVGELMKHGVATPAIMQAKRLTLKFQAIMMQLHLHGARNLWSDMIEPAEASGGGK